MRGGGGLEGEIVCCFLFVCFLGGVAGGGDK